MAWDQLMMQKTRWMGLVGCLAVLSVFWGYEANAVTVPNVTGLTLTAAQNQLTAAGLYAAVTSACSDTASVNSVINQTPLAGSNVPAGTTVTLTVANGPCTVQVPSLIGLAVETAQAQLQSAGLYSAVTTACSDTVSVNSVISQVPSAGNTVSVGSTVNLTVASGPCTVQVPELVGLSLAMAESQLQLVGLSGVVGLACSDTVSANHVISQVPAAGGIVSVGSTVNLTVASGPCTVLVPTLTGLTREAALTLLQSAGLAATVQFQCDDTIPAQTVTYQDPSANTQVNIGSTVVITVSSGPCSVVPSVIGYPEPQARQIIESAGFLVSGIQRQCSDLIAVGDVVIQVPAGGTQVGMGTGVSLIVSNGRCNSTGGGLGSVLVPTLIGLGEVEASSRIRAAGLIPGTVTRECVANVPSGIVTAQTPAPLTTLAAGSVVAYRVSAGPCVTVPDLAGLNQEDALAALSAVGLTAGIVTRQCQTSGEHGVVISQGIAAGSQVNAGTAVALTVSDTTCVTVPGIIGLQAETAQATLVSVNLYLNVSGSACDDVTTSGILSQTPAAGSLVASGTTIDAVVSSGPCPVSVPDVLGKTEATARSLLVAAGLTVKVQSECNNRIVTGSVIRQVPLPEATVEPGSEVTIHVSTGKCPVTLPNVVGLSYEDARGELINAGIDPANIQVVKQFSNSVPANQVINQSPAAETEVPADTKVTLVVSRGIKPEPPDNAQIEQVLYRGFVIADRNNDGKLTFEEVLDVLPGLTEDVFNAIDENSDGAITQEELARFLRIGGCFGCLRNLWPFKMMTGDLLLFGISLVALVGVSLRRTDR